MWLTAQRTKYIKSSIKSDFYELQDEVTPNKSSLFHFSLIKGDASFGARRPTRVHVALYLLLSPAGDSAPSMHLSSWLATICRSSSSSRVSRSNWSSCGEEDHVTVRAPRPSKPLFNKEPVRIKTKNHSAFKKTKTTPRTPLIIQ